MIAQEQTKLKRLITVSYLSIALLIIGETSLLISESTRYVFSVLVAIIIAGIQWFYWHKKGSKGRLRKVLVLGVLLLTVLSPILYIAVSLFVLGGSALGLKFFLALSFILPIVLQLYVVHTLQALLDNQT